MKEKKIELNILVFILIEGLYLLFFFKTSLLNIIIGTILGIILILITKNIQNNKITSIFLFIISLLLCINILNKITNFISINILSNYPTLIITITFLLVCIYLAFKGYHTYIKSLEITFYFYLLVKIVSVILLLPNINIHNFNYQLLEQAHFSINSLYIALTLLFLNLSTRYLTNYQVKNNVFIISTLNPIIMKILAISIIGTTLFNLYNYPYFSILKKIKYLEFIERMEGILSFEYLVCFIFLTSFLILLMKTIIEKLFKKI